MSGDSSQRPWNLRAPQVPRTCLTRSEWGGMVNINDCFKKPVDRHDPDAWIANDELFRRELALGYELQCYVGQKLEDEGLEVYVPPLRVRPDVNDRAEYADKGDIFVGHDPTFILQVKSRKLWFTGPKDFPFEDVIFYAKHAFDILDPKPVATVIISQQTQGIAVVSTRSKLHWKVLRSKDYTRQYRQNVYTIHRDRLLSFQKLVEFLSGGRIGA